MPRGRWQRPLWNGTMRRGPACFLAGCCSVTYDFRAISRQFFAAAHVLLALGPAFERNCARYSLRRLRCCGSRAGSVIIARRLC